MNRYLSILFLFILSISTAITQENDVWFQPNRGQWDSQILYRVSLNQGDFFIEKDKFTFALNNLGEIYHHAHENNEDIDLISHHTVFAHFKNSSWEGEVIESDSSTFYNNYILGNDQNQWKSKLYSYHKLKFLNYYPGIHLILETTPLAIKYSFEVEPGVDPSIIQIFYEGMDKLSLSQNELSILTRFGAIKEYGLKAWSDSENSIPIKYALQANTISFLFPNGYNQTETLIIDPYLTFSTFTGATSDNWGFTATPDNQGNLYAGGIVFGPGYPTSPGAYDNSYNSGYGNYKIDIGISKFSSDGTQLMYSTFLGGNGNETPNSIITNDQNELYILGVSTSTNFPTSPGAYQTINNGGTVTTQIAIKFDGTDIIVSKLSADGTTLLASTYLGGTSNDGLNISNLNYNYGDVFRGDITIDQDGNIVIASSTLSSDFPIVNGSNTILGGNQDAVVAKLNPNLTSLIWSTYLGGSGDDAGFSIQVNSSNNLLVTGGTKSTNLPFSGGYLPTYQGGTSDGYVAELDGNTNSIIRGTYIGTSSYDQSFFVQLDNADRVYVFGQSLGNIPVSSGVYSKPNSGQFIQQYAADLTTLNWSTRVGGGNGVVEISPTAFLVTNCNEIYYTGWGGSVNSSNSQAVGSTTFGFPTTSDAYQSNTNGSNFYIGVLTADATALSYGTFMGGMNSSYNHVDGGTSRFDKHGRIYHAVCGACAGNPNGFTTTPGAYSTTNNSSNCNMAAWKFDLYAINSALSVPNALICLPDSVHFTNTSQNGDTYHWDFGDGHTSTQYAPNHFYPNTGTYEVELIVSDSQGCFEPDTSVITIYIGDFHGGITQPATKVCPGTPFQLEASGGSTYSWTPAQYLDDPTSPTPLATIDVTTEFTVVVSDSCGVDTLKVTLETYTPTADAIDDQTMCKGDVITLWADGGGTYTWTTNDMSSILSNTTTSTISISPTVTSDYTATIITPDGCELKKYIHVTVFQDKPHPELLDSLVICKGDSKIVTAMGGDSITWYPNTEIMATSDTSVVIFASSSRWYYVDFSNPCGTVTDSIYVEVKQVFPAICPDTTVCPGDPIVLWATGGISYVWTPDDYLAHPHDSITTGYSMHPDTYYVQVTDENGCSEIAQTKVFHYPEPKVYVGSDYIGFAGDEVPLSAQGNSMGSYMWSPTEYLSCVNCQDPIATPPSSMTYEVTFIDENGCKAKNQVKIEYKAIIYVPNTFTPNESGYNDVFYAVGGNIQDFYLAIFNRWGELIFETHDMNIPWDGTYGGQKCPDGTYVWKISYTGIDNFREELVGHINLLR